MRENFTRFLGCVLVAGFTVAGTFSARSADTTEKPDAKEKAPEVKPHPRPFNGKIVSIDKAHKTITLSGEKARVVHITPHTHITKAGKHATFDEATVGEEVGGAAIHSADGKMEATSLRIGPKPEPKPEVKPKQKPQDKTDKPPQ
jgi:hypothetical protein